MTKRLTQISACLWVLSFFLSLPVIAPHALARIGAVTSLVIALCIAGSLHLIKDKKVKIIDPLSILIGLFFVWAGISLLWSETFLVSAMALWALFLFPGTFLLFRLLDDDKQSYKIAIYGAGTLLFGLAFWVLYNYFFLPELLVNGQVRIPFANPNSFAALLMLGFFAGLGIMMVEKDKLRANLALVFCMIIIAAIVILAGRGVMIALVLFSLFYLFLTRKFITKHSRCLAGVAIAIVVAFILPTILETHNETMLNRLSSLADSPETVAGTRLIIWKATWQMIQDHFWLGTGFGNFFLYYPSYRLPQDTFSGGFMAHNDPLQFWAEMGLIAPLLFYVSLITAAFFMARFLKKTVPTNESRILPGALFCGLAAIALHTHISYDFYVASILGLCGVVLFFWWQSVHQPKTQSTVALSKPVAGLVTMIPVALFLYFVPGLFVSEYHISNAKKYLETGNMEHYAHAVNKANKSSHGLNAKAYVFAATMTLGMLEMETNPGKREALYKQTTDLLDKAEKHNPHLVSLYYNRAVLLQAQNKDFENILQQALEISPQHLPSRVMLADYYNAKGQKDKAWAVTKAGLSWTYITHDPQLYYSAAMLTATQRGDSETTALIREKLNKLR